MSPRVTEIRDRIAPIVDAHGVDLEDVAVATVGRRDVVRVVVDRDGGVDLDTIADMSTAISASLDEDAGLFAGAYVLEVTSPGVDRPLTEPRHWRRARGRLVVLERHTGDSVRGRIIDSSEDSVVMELADGSRDTIPFSDISNAVIEIEFSRAGED